MLFFLTFRFHLRPQQMTEPLLRALKSSTPSIYVASNGEEWREIRFPGFRKTEQPKANRWVSSWGRVLSFGGFLVDRKISGDYAVTSIPICGREGTLGTSRLVGIHVLVAYSFLSKPKHAEEVDHKDRKPYNNHVDNLRWVTPAENMNNRERLTFVVRVDDEDFTDLQSLSRKTDIHPRTLRNIVDQSGTELPLCKKDKTLVIISKSKRPLKHVDHDIRRRRRVSIRSAETRAMDMFLSGKTIEQMTNEWPAGPIATQTVCNYLYKAARQMTREELNAVVRQAGMTDPETFASYRQALHEEFKEDKLCFEERYRAIVVRFYPHLSGGDEWRIARQFTSTFAALNVQKT